MSNSILLGPILGYEQGSFYTVCVLLEPGATVLNLDLPDMEPPGGAQTKFEKVAGVGENEFWRAEIPISPSGAGRTVRYQVSDADGPLSDPHDRVEWSFYVPGLNEEPLIAYASCNGFSSAKLARDTDQPFALWGRMKLEHAAKPYALLLMGGDQVYADDLWESRRCPNLQRWSEKDWDEQIRVTPGPAMIREIAAFYDGLYLERWKDETMSLMLATIPSVMMWDDHDIFDGWGSYPDERQQCDVFQAVFKEAARVYDILQLRCSGRNRLNPGAAHRTLRLTFRGYQILALDNRSERTMDRIMSEQNWLDVKSWLSGLSGQSVPSLLVMAGVPVVYRSFAAVESMMDATPWHEELEDDVHDHWSTRSHVAERMRLVMVLLKFMENHQAEKCKAILLSGDVHVGALGQIWDASRKLRITQLISSGIVHPPPGGFQWAGLQIMTGDKPEPLGDGDVAAEMLTPTGGPRYLRTRNYATLFTGTDQKVWINWICQEAKWKPSFAVS